MKPEEEVKQTEEQEMAQDTATNAGEESAQATEEKAETTDNSAEDVATSEDSLEEKYAKLEDTHLRLMAEYDNYRKRSLKEKAELIRNGGEKTLKDLLPVLDDLDIALANIEKAEDVKSVKEGVQLIHNKLMDYLKRQGIQVIETEDQAFDDELHEAIATFPAPEEDKKGKVFDCVKKGYKLNEKVIRHAQVVVGQ